MFRAIKNKFFSKNLQITSTSRSMTTGSANMNDEIVEAVVCKTSDVPENGMKEFTLGDDHKVLLFKQGDCVYATGTKCSHYGAPLVTGDLGCDGKVRCPWHGAMFDIKTGDIEDCPGLDSLPSYKVSISENGDVKVSGKKSELKSNKRVVPYKKGDKTNETYVIIGSGAAGSACAENLRKQGFSGNVIMISKDKYLPYDRPKVSKVMDITIDKARLRDEVFYKNYEIQIANCEKVNKVDTKTKKVFTDNGKEYEYSKLFIACGLLANHPNFTGSDLKNIFTVRDLSDAEKITATIKPESNVAIIGTSFIGMEAASYLNGKVANITVFGRSSVPFEPILGKEIGASIQKMYEDKGIKFVNGSQVEKFIGEGDKLSGLVVNGQTYPADICITGLGASFDTDFLKDSDIKLNDRGAIEVDEFLQTSNNDVWAGGDVVSAPLCSSNGEKASVGHWQLAQYHGLKAAANMAGNKKPIKTVPFFFSAFFGKGLRYAGHGRYNDIVTVGNVNDLKFVAYYLNGSDVVAASSMQFDPVVAKVANYMLEGKKLTRDDVLDNKWLSQKA